MIQHVPTERRVDAGSVSLGCLEYGCADARPLLMFHGLADSAWSLDPLAQELAAHFHVFSFDLRGHGRSDWGAYTLAHLVGDIRGVVETLDVVDPILVGHSLGGQSAAQFCGLYPELPRALVLLEALGPPPNRKAEADPDGHQREYFRHITEMVRQPAKHRVQPDLETAVARFRSVHPLLSEERARFLVEKNTLEQAEGEREWRLDPDTRDWLAGHDFQRAEQRWGGVTCPTLAVLGTDSWDRFWQPNMIMSADLDGPMSDAELQRRLSKFADARHVMLEGAGHMLHYDQPEALNNVVVDFLGRLST
ncbi:MAG: pimeloyl-ACP methyl ester carboxylesterase [Acidimicrobiales bacterium]|jgi:pimeloyl-ACP methyl ester carboxylesterase